LAVAVPAAALQPNFERCHCVRLTVQLRDGWSNAVEELAAAASTVRAVPADPSLLHVAVGAAAGHGAVQIALTPKCEGSALALHAKPPLCDR
jgi:hypothetical protein